MTWVKICGITNLEDALRAVGAGADAVGFVFHEQSPRYVDPGTAAQIVAQIPSEVEKVGVFVDESVERVREVVREVGLSTVQLHGSETVAFASSLASSWSETIRILKVVAGARLPTAKERPSSSWDPACWGVLTGEDAEMFNTLASDNSALSSDLVHFRPGPLSGLVLDSGSEGQGGTGKKFDWERARAFVDGIGSFTNIIVAGGLTPLNVAEAIRVLHPWGVDVSSGVEATPGRKDPEKIRDFVDAVRRMEFRA